MKTGIVILNYNDAKNTIQMIQQIEAYSCLDKIVIVDNKSTDQSLEQIKPYEKNHIVILEAKENKGYAAGNNIGLKYLKEHNFDFAFISNPDVVVTESVMEKLLTDMKEQNDISFLGPKILEAGHISKGWKLPTYKVELLSVMNFIHRYAKKLQNYPSNHYQESLTQVEVISGCFFLARLKDFAKIKFFDPQTFLYFEENIIAKKAQEKNMKTFVDTSVSIEHQYSQSIDKTLNKVKKYKCLQKSMFYYEETYNHISFGKKLLLKIVYFISLFLSYLTFWI